MTWRRRPEDHHDRTPVMIQQQEAECGAVALAIVLAHHGGWAPLPEVRERCGVTRFGCNAGNLLKAARSYALDARAVRLPVDQLQHLPTPAILFWQNAHFLVLERIAGELASINDPASGRRTMGLADLAHGYSGIAFPMTPTATFKPTGDPPRPLRDLVAMLEPARRTLTCLAIAIVFETSGWALAALAAFRLLDQSTGDEATVVTLAVMSSVIAIGALFIQGWLLDRAIAAIAAPRIDAYLDDLATLPTAFIELRQPAGLGGRLRLPESLAAIAVDSLTVIVRSVAIVTVWFAVMATATWWLAASWAASLAVGAIVQARHGAAQRTAAEHRAMTFGRRGAREGEAVGRNVVTQANGDELGVLASLVTGGEVTGSAADSMPASKIRARAALGLGLAMPLGVAGCLAYAGNATAGELALTLFAVATGARAIGAPGTLRRAWDVAPGLLRQLSDSRDEQEYSAGIPARESAPT